MKIYSGNEPYAFISYSHKDNNQVESLLELFTPIGARFWSDVALRPTDDYTEIIAKKIERAALVIVFLSDHYVSSSFCLDELHFAHSCNQKILPIFLQDCLLSSGIRMIINRYQHYKISGKSKHQIFEDLKCFFPKNIIHNEGYFLGKIKSNSYYFCKGKNRYEYDIIEISQETNTKTVLLHKTWHPTADILISYSTQRWYPDNQNIIFEILIQMDPMPYPTVDYTITHEIEHSKGETRLITKDVSTFEPFSKTLTRYNYVEGVYTKTYSDGTVNIFGTDIKGNNWNV